MLLRLAGRKATKSTPYACRTAAARQLSTVSNFNIPALEKLKADAASSCSHHNDDAAERAVLLVDLLRTPSEGARRAWRAHSDLLTSLVPHAQTSLVPHGESVLLGDNLVHQFERIVIREFKSAADALTSLTNPELADLRLEAAASGSVLLRASRSAMFAHIPSFEEAGGEAEPVDESPPRSPLLCPFINERNAHPKAWTALDEQPSKHMYAFNLIRIPDPMAYQEYSSNFPHLGPSYGMKPVAVMSTDPNPAVSLLYGSPLGSISGDDSTGGFDLLAAVYFPTSRCFVKAWSDEQVVTKGFPMRERMLAAGFEHIWLRCSAAD